MSSTAKVIVIFAGLTAAGSGVIGYGVYRKVQRKRERREMLSRARGICETSPETFALMGSGERSDMLDRAERTKIRTSGLADIDPEEPAAVARWIEDATHLHETLDNAERTLHKLSADLSGYEFPQEGVQPPPGDVQRLRQRLEAARAAESALKVRIGRQTLDLTGSFCAELVTLAKQADQVERELNSRERAYRAFKEKVLRAIRSGDAAKAGELSKEWTGTWRQRVAADPNKTDMLTRLHKELQAVHERPMRRKAAVAKLVAVIRKLRAERPDPKARPQESAQRLQELSLECEQAVAAAAALPHLEALIEEAQRALGAARSALTPKKPSPQELADSSDADKHAAIAEIAKGMQELEKIRPLDVQPWAQGILKVRTALDKLGQQDARLAQAVAKLVQARIDGIRERPRVTGPLFTEVPVEVSWSDLRPARRLLDQARASLQNLKDKLRKTDVPKDQEKQRDLLQRYVTTALYSAERHQRDLERFISEWDKLVKKGR